jgi:hypothetical protein
MLRAADPRIGMSTINFLIILESDGKIEDAAQFQGGAAVERGDFVKWKGHLPIYVDRL